MYKMLKIIGKVIVLTTLLIIIISGMPGKTVKTSKAQNISPTIPTEMREISTTDTPESVHKLIPTATVTTGSSAITQTIFPSLTPTVPKTITLPAPQGLIAFSDWTPFDGGVDIIRPDGSGLKRLTTHHGYYQAPAWSPDGQWIAYSMGPDDSKKDSRDQIFIMRLDGTNIKQLTFGTSLRTDPTWSPDGQNILFSEFNGNGGGVYMIARDGSHYQPIITSDTTVFTHPSWSPDGKSIAYVGTDSASWNADLFIMDPDGKNRRKLNSGWVINDRFRDPLGKPTWSPNSQLIFFTSSDCQIYQVDINEGNLQRISNGIGQYAYPSISPDGLYLAFSYGEQGARTCLSGPSSGYEIGLMTPDNQLVITINSGQGFIPQEMAWSPVPELRTGSIYTLTDLGDRLTLRASPTIKGNVVTHLNKGDTVTVEDGPVYADYYYWWKLRAADGTEGWAVDTLGWYAKK